MHVAVARRSGMLLCWLAYGSLQAASRNVAASWTVLGPGGGGLLTDIAVDRTGSGSTQWDGALHRVNPPRTPGSCMAERRRTTWRDRVSRKDNLWEAKRRSVAPLIFARVESYKESLGRRGLLSVADCKMGALETRAAIQAAEDFYLCPLSEINCRLRSGAATWPRSGGGTRS
jgi:hypothetical protein